MDIDRVIDQHGNPDEEMDWDVVVVGRSYAGLSAALVLGRARRSVLVIGSGGPRNEAVAHAHGMLTRDGAAPGDVIAAGEAELDRYPTVEVIDGRVAEIARIDGGFRVTFAKRTATATFVVLATGANDAPPATPGLADHWGRGVFTCPYCDGFEHADAAIAVVGNPQFVPHLAKLLTNWSDRVTVYATGLDDEARDELVAGGVRMDGRAITRVIGDGRRVTRLELDDGTAADVGAVFLAELPTPNSGLAADLGCQLDAFGRIVVDATTRATSEAGVWAAGDVTDRQSNMAIAIADGGIAAAHVNVALVERRWRVRTSAYRP